MTQVTESLLGFVFIMGALAALVAGAVRVLEGGLHLRARNLRRGIAELLYALRVEKRLHGFDRYDAKQHAAQVLTAANRDDPFKDPRERNPERACNWVSWLEPARFGRIAALVVPDLSDLGLTLAERLEALDGPLRRRFRLRIRLLTVFAALSVAGVAQIDAFALLGDLQRDFWNVTGAFRLWPGGAAYYVGLSGWRLDSLIGVLVTAILLVFMAPVVFEAVRRRPRRDEGEAEAREAETKTPTPPEGLPPTIGEKDRAIRAINFGGGGFDTLMQLGVTHALLVIQGRAPDAVVGISAGAIQAAALAEVLQAGQFDGEWVIQEAAKRQKQAAKPEKLLSVFYRQVLHDRVRRFREFLYAARQAPERLIDAVLPDAYEIDARNPLRPLEAPVFFEAERAGRMRALGMKTGLVRLYNDLLSIQLRIGTVARFIRRILGFLAAGEVRSAAGKAGTRSENRDRMARAAARTVELLRVWLLLGRSLARSAPLAIMLLWPFSHRKVKARAASAGTLIFRFEELERFLSGALNLGVFVILLVVWVSVSWLVISPLAWAFLDPKKVPIWVPWGLLVLYAIPIFAFTKIARDWDRSDRLMDVLREQAKGVVMFAFLMLKWSVVAVLLILIGALALSPMFESLALPLELSDELWNYVRHLLFISNFLAIVLGLLVALGVSVWLFQGWLRKRRGIPSTGRFRKWYLRRFLRRYNLEESLAATHPLEYFLAELFDPKFYGQREFDEAVEDSLADQHRQTSSEKAENVAAKKKVALYAEAPRCRPIHVGLAAADVGSGEMCVMPKHTSVVEGLKAATAVAPIFPPKRLGKNLYVDGTNVANVPTRALVKLLRESANEDSKIALIYSVSPFPLSRPRRLGRRRANGNAEGGGHYLDLVDIALRALELRRYSDAKLEKELTELYTEVMPPGKFVLETKDKRFFRARVTPIDLEEPPELWRRVLVASEAERHRAIHELVADGCRASLEVMIREAADGCRRPEQKAFDDAVPCEAAVQEHKRLREEAEARRDEGRNFRDAADVRLPGSSEGPGLSEICTHCALRRGKAGERARHLQVVSVDQAGPAWPHEMETGPDDVAEPRARQDAGKPKQAQEHPLHVLKKKRWPRDRFTKKGEKRAGDERPVVSLLFSGGVFRGVFQMGVLNALRMLDVKPDIIAGASVGSITAAMAAQAFSRSDDGHAKAHIAGLSGSDDGHAKAHIARLSAVYLAADRLILTDRFADFVRNFTIRAAGTRFSLRDADRLFRTYDRPTALEFDRNARRVIAALERLFYINPYQLNSLVQAFRRRERRAAEEVKTLAQEWLRRMNVGEEVLGAEPLERLIRHYVLPEAEQARAEYEPFDRFQEEGIVLLATATNLDEGNLEILGQPGKASAKGGAEPMLVEGLLASSAFPGVFRPRWSWDLFPGVSETEQYLDGGLFDNLPIGEVIRFLDQAAEAGLTPRRPKDPETSNGDPPDQPHLVFAASLEPDAKGALYEGGSWIDLVRRVGQLGYNKKADAFATAQEDIRKICAANGGQEPRPEPLDLEVVTVKPLWLCGTFAFHPMLGFRRERQARSIAHGCASTLLRFAAVDEKHRDAWLLDRSAVPQDKTFRAARKRWEARQDEKEGLCWLISKQCPYSRAELEKIEIAPPGDSESGMPNYKKRKLPKTTIRELEKICEFCKQPLTHARPDAGPELD